MGLTLGEKRQGRRPIDFYFRSVVDAKSDKVAFIDAFQVLNDIYLGRMNVVNYFFIAESSIRINELNLIAISELDEFRNYMYETRYIPKVTYNLPLTTRFLQNEKDFVILQDTLRQYGYKKGELILTFNSASLVKDGDKAETKKRLERLRRMGFGVGISGFGAEFNSLDIFADFNFSQLRVEASYFDSSVQKKKLLSMLTKFCRSNKIEMVVEGVDTPPQLKRFKASGIKYVTGKAVCKLNKWVTREMLHLPELTDAETKEWDLKVEAAKKAAERKAAAAEIKSRSDAAKAIAEMGLQGTLTTAAPPKPAGYKSPYQARLEQQRLLAKKAAQNQEQKKILDEKKKLAERKAAQEKAKLEALGGWGLSGLAGNTPMRRKDDDEDIAETENQELEFVADSAQSTNTNRPETTSKTDEKNVFKLSGEGGVEFEFEEVSPDEEEGGEGQKPDGDAAQKGGDIAAAGQREKSDEEDATAAQAEGAQLFDLGELPQGSYNEQGQWVDAEGNVFNGYFDEEGRWIDYGFYGADGQWLDNGYYDEKKQKWVPFGYFDDEGNWVSLI
jgi:EAL domain-containing protein (putative c-di-GMP-specific phosphodiesterase class I)